jgi:small subunit ribosomal protein S3
LLGKNSVDVSVQEIKVPDLDALLVAKSITEQLEQRVSFKKTMKRAAAGTMRVGATGIKICCSGRLNGAEIARSEWLRIGSVPLHTLRMDIDYALAEAKTTYGIIGVRVWIGRGEYQLLN